MCAVIVTECVHACVCAVIVTECVHTRVCCHRDSVCTRVCAVIVTECVHARVCWDAPLFATPWPGACPAPPFVGFSSQAYCSESPFPTPGDLSDPGIEPTSLSSPALAGGFFTTCTGFRPSNRRTVLLDILLYFALLVQNYICEFYSSVAVVCSFLLL